MRLTLDISRLIERARRPTPTGIDRVEMAYALHLAQSADLDLSFAAIDPAGRIGVVDAAKARKLIAALDVRWREGSEGPSAPRIAALMADLLARGEGRWARQSGREPLVYLLASHHHLDRGPALRDLRRRTGAALAFIIHDITPLAHPEFAGRGEPERHRRRMTVAGELAGGLIYNSEATRLAFAPFLRPPTPDLVAPFGFDLADDKPRPSAAAPDRPYFICLGTVEPNKNHALLIQVWRRLKDAAGERAPRLMVVGRPGWRSDALLEFLRFPADLSDVIEYRPGLPDSQIKALVAGARALLMPSFTEGFGFPLGEALALGTPAICSDLPALRSLGGAAPDYLDPLDGLGWLAAITDYAFSRTSRRQDQLVRLRAWAPRTWAEHLGQVLPFLATLAPASAGSAGAPPTTG
jgi:glycosyltransferase involved in cell wall biosynthesis